MFHIYFDPIPNFIFTRDIAVFVHDYVIITKAAKSARFRENLLTRFIFAAHPMFSDTNAQGKIINLNDLNAFPPSKMGESKHGRC
jgi:arginine deiminase